MDPQQPLTYWEQLGVNLDNFKESFQDQPEFTKFLDGVKTGIENLPEGDATKKSHDLLDLITKNINSPSEDSNSKLTQEIVDKIKTVGGYLEIIYAFCYKIVDLNVPYSIYPPDDQKTISCQLYTIIITLINSARKICLSDNINSLISPIERFSALSSEQKPETVIIALNLIVSLCSDTSNKEFLLPNKYECLNPIIRNLINRKLAIIEDQKILDRAFGFHANEIVRMIDLAITQMIFFKINYKIDQVLKINDTSWVKHTEDMLQEISLYCPYIQNPIGVLYKLRKAMQEFLNSSYKSDRVILRQFSRLSLELLYLAIYQYDYRPESEKQKDEYILPINSQTYFNDITKSEKDEGIKSFKATKAQSVDIKKLDIETAIEMMYINYCMRQAYNFLPYTCEPKEKLKKMLSFIPVFSSTIESGLGFDPSGTTSIIGGSLGLAGCVVSLVAIGALVAKEVKTEIEQRKQKWGHQIMNMRMAQMSFLTRAQLSTSKNKEFELLIELSKIQLEIKKILDDKYNWELDHCALDILTNIILYSPFESIKIAAFFGYETEFEIAFLSALQSDKIAQWRQDNSEIDTDKAKNNNVLFVYEEKKQSWTIYGRGNEDALVITKVEADSSLKKLLPSNEAEACQKNPSNNFKYEVCNYLNRYPQGLCGLIINCRNKQVKKHGIDRIIDNVYEEFGLSDMPNRLKDLVEKTASEERMAYLYESVILHGFSCLNRIFDQLQKGEFVNFLERRFNTEEEIIQAEKDKDNAFKCLLYHATREEGEEKAHQILQDFYKKYVSINIKSFEDNYVNNPAESLNYFKAGMRLYKRVDKERYTDKNQLINSHLKDCIRSYILNISQSNLNLAVLWCIKLIRIAILKKDNIEGLAKILLNYETEEEASINDNVLLACEELIDEREYLERYKVGEMRNSLKNGLESFAIILNQFFSGVTDREKINNRVEQVRLIRNALLNNDKRAMFDNYIKDIKVNINSEEISLLEKISLWKAPLSSFVETKQDGDIKIKILRNKEDFVGYLGSDYVQEIIDENGYIKRRERSGSSYQASLTCVNSIEDKQRGISLHLKADPCFPGQEYMARSFLKLMFNIELPLEIVWFQPVLKKKNKMKKMKPYPVMVTKTIQGNPLSKNTATMGENTKININLTSFTKAFIASLFLRSEDGKADNFILENSGANDADIICLDNELLFADSLAVTKLENEKTMTIVIKNMIYCLDQMNDQVDQAVLQQFIKKIPDGSSIKRFMQLWLSDLAQFDAHYIIDDETNEKNIKNLIGLLDKKIDQRVIGETSLITPFFLKERDVLLCYETLYRLQDVIKKKGLIDRTNNSSRMGQNNAFTHFDLLMQIDAILGLKYKKVFEDKKTPDERFKEISKKQYIEKVVTSTRSSAENGDEISKSMTEDDMQPKSSEKNSEKDKQVLEEIQQPKEIKGSKEEKKLSENEVGKENKNEIIVNTDIEGGNLPAGEDEAEQDEKEEEEEKEVPEQDEESVNENERKLIEEDVPLVTIKDKKTQEDQFNEIAEEEQETVLQTGITTAAQLLELRGRLKEVGYKNILRITMRPFSREACLKATEKESDKKNVYFDALSRLEKVTGEKNEFENNLSMFEKGKIAEINIETSIMFEELICAINFNAIKGTEKISKQEQEATILTGIVELLKWEDKLSKQNNLRKATHLKFIDCSALTDDKFIAIIDKLRNLKIIELNHCQAITHKALYYISLYCPSLEVLRLINLPGLVKIQGKDRFMRQPIVLTFEYLKRFYVSDCSNLSTFGKYLNVNKLNKLSLSNCKELTISDEVQLNAVGKISLIGLKNVDQSQLVNFKVSNTFSDFNIDNCEQLKHAVTFYRKFPFLCGIDFSNPRQDFFEQVQKKIESFGDNNEIDYKTNIYNVVKTTFEKRIGIIKEIKDSYASQRTNQMKARLFIVLAGIGENLTTEVKRSLFGRLVNGLKLQENKKYLRRGTADFPALIRKLNKKKAFSKGEKAKLIKMIKSNLNGKSVNKNIRLNSLEALGYLGETLDEKHRELRESFNIDEDVVDYLEYVKSLSNIFPENCAKYCEILPDDIYRCLNFERFKEGSKNKIPLSLLVYLAELYEKAHLKISHANIQTLINNLVQTEEIMDTKKPVVLEMEYFQVLNKLHAFFTKEMKELILNNQFNKFKQGYFWRDRANATAAIGQMMHIIIDVEYQKKAYDLLFAALDHQGSYSVRTNAITSIIQLETLVPDNEGSKVVHNLMDKLDNEKDKSWTVRANAAKSISECPKYYKSISFEQLDGVLHAAAIESSYSVRQNALTSLVHLHDYIYEGDPKGKEYASYIVDELFDQIKDKNWPARANAARLFSHVPTMFEQKDCNNAVFSSIEKAAGDRKAYGVRRNAVTSMGEVYDKVDAELQEEIINVLLTKIRNDSNWEVKIAAIKAVRKNARKIRSSQKNDVITVLQKALKNSYWEVYYQAAKALAAFSEDIPSQLEDQFNQYISRKAIKS